ncbi:thioredoxin-like protein [Thamnidium elegans]|nr:thioredoxin-like protein [Thamnidium elegans]
MSALKSQLKGLKELRLQFCQTSPSSSGLRDFIAKNYVSIKKANPELPILVREASGIEARAFARFDKGIEHKITLKNASAQDIENTLAQLVKSA